MKKDWDPRFIFTINGDLHEVEAEEGRSEYHNNREIKAIETEVGKAMAYFESLAKAHPQSVVRMYKLVGQSEPLPPSIHWKEREDQRPAS